MHSRIKTSAVVGIDAFEVEVEVDINERGLPHFSIVGLPDTAVKESRDRIKSALKNSGFIFPQKQITVNLAPADLRKEGASFDLPIALGILCSEGVIPQESLDGFIVTGELALDGRVKPIKGVLSMALLARKGGFKGMILPKKNAREASVVKGIKAFGVDSLIKVLEFLKGEREISPEVFDLEKYLENQREYDEDFSDVKGQEHAKRAMEVAAAGGHNILMIGPPGSGKTMLARRLPTILPDMTFEEALETSIIHSVAGLLPAGRPLLFRRPFRSPHHTISDVALIGGGQHPKPGEVSLAHNGVLFLDELPEFKKNVLEVLRQPLEDGEITVSRASATIVFPSRFMLVGAMNPCPCGNFGSEKPCICTPAQIQKYRRRLSSPLLDRIDIHIEVPAVDYKKLSSTMPSETSEEIRKRVERARKLQLERFKGERIYCNGQMSTRQIKKHCQTSQEAKEILESAVEKMGLSARAYTRILKVSRTIADLEGSESIQANHISEAVQYRMMDRGVF